MWNLVEIGNRLSGDKGPNCQEYGAKLWDWQLADLTDTKIERLRCSPLAGANQILRWHPSEVGVEIRFHRSSWCYSATWMSCVAGKERFGFSIPRSLIWKISKELRQMEDDLYTEEGDEMKWGIKLIAISEGVERYEEVRTSWVTGFEYLSN